MRGQSHLVRPFLLLLAGCALPGCLGDESLLTRDTPRYACLVDDDCVSDYRCLRPAGSGYGQCVPLSHSSDADGFDLDLGDGGIGGPSDGVAGDTAVTPNYTVIPLPEPPSPRLEGPRCPDPPHAPIGTDWPEVFVSATGCDDAGPGTEALPFCTFGQAFEVADTVPYVVTVREGTYRLPFQWDAASDQSSFRVDRKGTADEYFVIRAYPGEAPLILGSRQINGNNLDPVAGSPDLFRVPLDDIARPIKGVWTDLGFRVIHIAGEDKRSHADSSALTDRGTWTIADDQGVACAESDQAGCYLYMRPPEGADLSATNFEVSQGQFLSAVNPAYMWIEGLSVRYTQGAALWFENTDYVLIQDSSFGGNAASVGEAYSLHLWDADGTIVRRVDVFDSRQWPGATNSHGITFMNAGRDAPNWVCESEVHDIIGHCVSSLGGSGRLNVVGNHIHHCGSGVDIPGSRCDWRGCDEDVFSGGAYVVRENLFEANGSGVHFDPIYDRPDAVFGSRVHNNTFVDNERGVHIRRLSHHGQIVRNNVYIGSGSGLFFEAGGTETWPEYYLERGFDSDNNIYFHEVDDIYVRANWSGLEEGFALDEYRRLYGADESSLATDPRLDSDDDYRPLSDSPALLTGDPSLYSGADQVNRGRWP